MSKKLHTFEDVIGHENLVEFLKGHLQNNTLPHFIIFEGDEGLGKTSLAKILAYYLTGSRTEVADRVIEQNLSTEDVLLYNMSVNGGKDTAKEVESNLSLGLTNFTTKVIICDEAHGMSEAAQDVFLVSTEYLPDGVYLFMCTTDSINLKPTLKSRAFTLHLNHLTNKEMVALLKRTVDANHLKLQAESTTLSLIAAWADGKPRIALNLLEGFGEGSAVSTDMVKEFIDYMGVDDVLPLLSCLSGSMTLGLSYINEMKLNSSLVPVLVECLKVKQGMATYKLSLTDSHKVRDQLADVNTNNLIKFIYLVAGAPKLSRSVIISAFLQAHHNFGSLMSPPDKADVIKEEMAQKLASPNPDPEDGTHRPTAPSLEDLLARGAVVE